MESALVIGCGYTGSRLAGVLLNRAVEVAATSRISRQIAGITTHACDLMREPALNLPRLKNAVIYYTVGTLIREYEPVSRPHLTPLRRALEAAAQMTPRGLIYLSATSVYGDCGGAWVDEDTPVDPQSPWGKMRVDLEQELWNFGAKLGIPACVVRLPEIYGPGRTPFQRLQAGYRLRVPDRYSNRIHVDDLVEVLALLGTRLDRRLLIVSDSCPETTANVYRYAAQLSGKPAPEIGGELPNDPNILSLVRDSKRCSNKQLLEWLDRPLKFPSYRKGFADLLSREFLD